jgi:hypothetical protein
MHKLILDGRHYNVCHNLPVHVIHTFDHLFSDADVGHIILVTICSILTAICIGIYIEEIVYILRADVHDRKERIRPIWVLGLYPVSQMFCVFGFGPLVVKPRIRLDRNLVCELLFHSGTYVQSFGSIAPKCALLADDDDCHMIVLAPRR